ncbi:MAG: GlmU family protein [Bacteroidales bacterium]|jgi:UDP-N-acetylglucosamine diphosphorylase/glucosamine-1-phosphate N-acetyltransferase|nr:GlmU family protein [Bacteroidales bacterium]
MNFILFDNFRRSNLFPLTYLRPVADIRAGILTIREKWEKYLGQKTSTLTESYLRKKFPVVREEDNIMINGSVCPNKQLLEEIHSLKTGEVLFQGDAIIAMRLHAVELEKLDDEHIDDVNMVESKSDILKITHTWDIFSQNDRAIREDFELLTHGRSSGPVSRSNQVIGDEIFIEKNAKVECCILNSSTGPIYIGEDAEIMEGSLIRGPFGLGAHATVKMGAKIYGPTTIGPHCKVGGEINNSVFFGFSNKAHDGFMGQSVIGEWCNIGADTNTSNLKNTYETIKLWNYADQTFVETGLQFCGLIMGDHSKCGINTMFNTGTVVGINSNIFGSGYQRNFIPSFSWGGPSGIKSYHIDRAVSVARKVYQRRGLEFDQTEEDILRDVYNLTKEPLS